MGAIMRGSGRRLLGGTVATCALLFVLGGSQAFGAGVLWRLDSNAAPTDLVPSQPARIIATAGNLGQATADGSGAKPITITDKLPGKLEVPTSVTLSAIEGKLEANDRSEAASTLACSFEEVHRKEVSCKTTATTQPLAPYTELKIVIPVELEPGAVTGEQNTVEVSGGEPAGGGGELPPAPALQRPITVGTEATPFGVEHYELVPEAEDGSTDALAASHPFQLTTTLDLNQTLASGGQGQGALQASAPALAKNLSFELPPGFLGNPQAVPQCSDVDFSSIGQNNVNACPADSAIGVALVTLNLPSPPLGVFTEAVPVFNLVPARGEPARFGLEDTKVPIILDASVRTNGDYGVNVTIHSTTQVAQLLSSRVVLWGEPDNQGHDQSRGWACIRGVEVNGESCSAPASRANPPFLTLPSSCLGAMSTLMHGEAWTGARTESRFAFSDSLGEPLASLEGCATVPFSPSIAVQPVDEQEGQAPGATLTSASTPTGLKVDVDLPGEEGSLGESAVRSTTVTLPAGLQLNPSAANGLEACSEGQMGYEGAGGSDDPFSPGTVEPLRFSAAPASCPDASKVGTVRIKSPDLANELQGGVYIAAQTNNPFGSLFAVYIVAEDPVSGVRVKLAGEVVLDEQTGQPTTSFKDTPQVPFESLKLSFFEGPRASLSTPARCGTYTTLASFTPWSSLTPLLREAGFAITSGPGGSGCSDPLPFAPGFQAGSTDTQAGAFTSFTLTLTRPDGNQALRALSVHLPAGIAAILASVTPCPEPQAALQQCPADSLIGHSSASSGLGPEPITLGGAAYLTGPYEGAPFGIEVLTPAIAGPFNLGNVTVRSRIEVDPHTAAVTITSDPIPTIIKGIPAQIKALNVTVDRPGFEFNPTNCNPMAIQGTIAGDAGATAAVSTPFQVANCQALPFAPKLTAQAAGSATKANGAAFAVKVQSQGLGQADIAKVNLQLPIQLPARLTTLQKACVAAVFEANPAACPEGSNIGSATVHTPVLKNPLTGPAYLVSHGGAAFPDVEFVLQGEGITLVLDGQTDIKKGITTSTFNAVPDAPVSTFETTLPEGPHSALTANVPESKKFSLCGAKLVMPTTITAQNGLVIKQQTKIPVSGCKAVKAFKMTRAQKLKKALKACRKQFKHKAKKLAACERKARKRYGAKKAKKKS